MITPLDIRNATFPKGMRGYKEESVDRFLDVLVLDYEKIFDENEQLKSTNAKLLNEIDQLRDQEKTVSDTINSAKQLVDELSDKAEHQAEMIIKNAELEAKTIVKESEERLETMAAKYDHTKERLGIFLNRYRMFLESEIDRFNGLNDVFKEDEDENENEIGDL